MKHLARHPIHLLSLGFGAGLTPFAPGTMGTLVGVILYIGLQPLSLPWYLLTVAILFVLGIGLCGATARALATPDHPAIVWDEMVGFLVTMTAAPTGWGWVLWGFILFRCFDIAKPWPIGIIDTRIRGGVGIMSDDLLAGLYALASLQLAALVLR
uniref:Phosphatidylglycerophosphatase A n=1 Tax=Candidatus Kentrum eta TaxID=2126337 RepID=A0A450VJ74_9GAMM|nr:MAG: phosphatidylglycerophosphatase A [Candidatus Kentron sp. H]VFK00836.1 MAG: phosphatidylglycerophosphatase A [Candidatus Kentron sp. H]VFK04862.1 MAG: phosphatidylglycerophosphatase A [Candidatus Kentron sp. H]